ncbi:hypothetical protein RUMHYD_01274, partial [Blautia hydrogenotrophica DSM 10507]
GDGRVEVGLPILFCNQGLRIWKLAHLILRQERGLRSKKLFYIN